MFLSSFCVAAAALLPSGGPSATGLPLVVVENRGQVAPNVLFEARTPGLTLRFTDEGIAVAGRGGTSQLVLQVLDAASARVEGIDPMTARVNFLGGAAPVSGVPTFGGVAYRDVRPGVDLIVRVADGQLEYDLELDPCTPLADIVLAWHGTEGLWLDADGDLVVDGPFGPLRQRAPVSWQVRADGSREPLASRFVTHGYGRFGFEVDGRDPELPLVVDPILTYRSYVGGGEADSAHGVAVDGEGAVYVAGGSESSDFPLGAKPLDGTRQGRDAVVFKLAPDGETLVYATFLGGERDDEAFDVFVDDAGEAYVVGRTKSEDFPVTPQGLQRSPRGLWDAFIVKLSADGSELVYASYLGGSADDIARAVVVDRSGSAYVVGETGSNDFPWTDHAMQRELLGTRDAFVTKIDDQGSVAVYSTLIGGSRDDAGFGVDVDSSGHAYVVGRTVSLDFPATAEAADVKKDELDGFIAKLGIDGAEMVWASFVGGTGEDEAHGVAVTTNNGVLVGGWTDSTDFPVTPNGLMREDLPGRDGFLVRLGASGSSFQYATLIGGGGNDECLDVASDRTGKAWVVGTTDSTDLPVTAGSFQTALSGGSDGFAARLDPTSGGPFFVTYFGSDGDDRLTSVAVHRSWGHVAVGGRADAIPPSARGMLGVGAGASSDALLGRFGRVSCSSEAARESLGGGCGAALTSSLPALGSALGVRVVGAPPRRRGAVVASALRSEPAYLGGCQLFLDLGNVTRVFPFTTDEMGEVEVAVPIPEHPDLCGAQFVLQAVVLAPEAGPLPFGQLSEALRIRLGN